MILLLLALALVGPYALLSLAGAWVPRARTAPRTRAKLGVTLLFLATGSGHFAQPEAMALMLPPWVPLRLEIIYLTGVLELLGAVAIWVPAIARLAGLFLILLLVGVLPANVYAAWNRVPFGGHEGGPLYLLVRVPFQVLLIGWTYLATNQRWLPHHRPIMKTRGSSFRTRRYSDLCHSLQGDSASTPSPRRSDSRKHSR